MTLRELVFKLVRETKGVAWEMPVEIDAGQTHLAVGEVSTESRSGTPTVVIHAGDQKIGEAAVEKGRP